MMFKLKLFYILLISVTSVLGARKCYTCDNVDDCAKLENPTECDEEMDTCTTIFDESDVSKRGCSTDLKIDCKNDEEKCFQCKSNQCNNAAKLEDYINCLDCTSEKDKDCGTGKLETKKKCNKSCMEYVTSDEKLKIDTITRTCLDDYDSEKQKECTDDKNKMCKSCNTKNCNKQITTLKCQQCTDVNSCKTPELKDCDQFKTTDQCYILYEKTDIKLMGCLSSNKDLTPDKIKELETKDEIFLCSGDDCNNKDKLPKKLECTLCHSETDANCAQNPKAVTNTTSCDIEENNACYMKVSEIDKSTQRGCWSSLSAEEKLNCTADNKNENCSACSGDKCNNEIFPQNRQVCNVCNSKDDPDCAKNNPNKEIVCLKYDKNDQCLSKLDNGITYRECVSNSNYTCNGKDQTCRKCKLPKCNIIDFANVFNDTNNSGMWQDLPLTCLTCDGESCKNNDTTNEKCKENLEDCITVFNKEGSVIMRGCDNNVADTYEIHCQKDPELCFNCKSDKCNNATKLDDFLDCTYCGWPNSPSCMEINKNETYSVRKCYKSCISALYKHYLDENEQAYNLIRTCMDDKLPKQQQECKTNIDENGLKCLKCDSGNCNNKNEFPKNRTSCHMCSNPEECANPNSKICPLYRENDQCYYVYNGGQVSEKGCSSSLTQKVINYLLINNKIHLCNGKECNSVDNEPKNSTCVSCNSRNDVNCAIDPTKLNKTVICAAPNSQCYTRVNQDGTTERGCLVTLKEDMLKCNSTANTTSSCQSCANAGCNKEIFPINRRSCQVCNSKDNTACHDNPQSSEICLVYAEDEKCVSTYNIKDKVTQRGCGQLLKCENDKNNKICEICDKNNCNVANLKKKNGSGTIMGNFIIISLLSVGLIIFTNKN